MQDGTVGQGLAEVTPVIGAMRASANTARVQGNTAWAEQLETWAYQIERGCAGRYPRYPSRPYYPFVVPPYYSYFHPINTFFPARTLTQLGPTIVPSTQLGPTIAPTTQLGPTITPSLTPGGGVVVR